ncbi:hypothetical protein BpHYR1_006154 [Brachionus plicatilis]|uniref:Uncharacterized protein n=1 Tax=Brachionus plicatilis TaxID=10195 RepID=A0A3M7RAW3_BRAPC|nr:hypothetical protein BpHYR1_006154 [Brachionus plicatilis]
MGLRNFNLNPILTEEEFFSEQQLRTHFIVNDVDNDSFCLLVFANVKKISFYSYTLNGCEVRFNSIFTVQKKIIFNELNEFLKMLNKFSQYNKINLQNLYNFIN